MSAADLGRLIGTLLSPAARPLIREALLDLLSTEIVELVRDLLAAELARSSSITDTGGRSVSHGLSLVERLRDPAGNSERRRAG